MIALFSICLSVSFTFSCHLTIYTYTHTHAHNNVHRYLFTCVCECLLADIYYPFRIVLRRICLPVRTQMELYIGLCLVTAICLSRSYNVLLLSVPAKLELVRRRTYSCVDAVSYTHLDVYKRQVCMCVRVCVDG